MKYGKNIIDKYIGPIKRVEEDIQALEGKLKELQEKLGADGNKYDLKTIEKQKEIRTEMNMIEQAVEKAKKHKDVLEKSIPDDVAEATLETIKQVRIDVNKDPQVVKDKELIIEYVKEIRAAYKRLRQTEMTERKELKQLVRTVEPYLLKAEEGLHPDDIKIRKATSQSLIGKVQSQLGMNSISREYEVLRGVPSEEKLKVRGLKKKL